MPVIGHQCLRQRIVTYQIVGKWQRFETELRKVLGNYFPIAQVTESKQFSFPRRNKASSVFRSHGLPEPPVEDDDVFQATVLAEITYCLPAWFGFCTAADHNRLDFNSYVAVLNSNTPSTSFIAKDIDDTLVYRITHHDYRILQSYLPYRSEVHFNLRQRYQN